MRLNLNMNKSNADRCVKSLMKYLQRLLIDLAGNLVWTNIFDLK